MNPSLPQNRPDRSTPASSRPLAVLVGILIMLIAVALLHPFARRKPAEDPLHGDSEEAAGAMPAALNTMPETARLPFLLQSAQNPSPGLRYAAVDALGSLHGPEVADAIEKAFTDSSSVVRQRAMEVLPQVDTERGLRLLLTGLHDEDDWIRSAAITQIGSRAHRKDSGVDKRAIPMMLTALHDSNPANAFLAAGVLPRLTGQNWKIKSSASEAERQALVTKWETWWQGAKAQFDVPPALADIAPIRPTRSDPAPDFQLRDTEGHTLSLSDQKGRVTLLNFWGTWCPPCQKELPDLIKLNETYRGQPFDIVGVALGEDSSASLKTWCQEHGVTYRQAMAQPDMLAAYGDIHEVPVSVLLDRAGRIRYRWEGERDFETFHAAVERLLRE